MSQENTAESKLIEVLTKEQQTALKKLRELVNKNSIENPSDFKEAQFILKNLPKEGIRESSMRWLTSLVKRKGKRFVLPEQPEIKHSKNSQK